MKKKKALLLSLMTLAILSVSNASEDKEVTEVKEAQETQTPAVTAKENKKAVFGHDEKVILPQFKNLQVHAKLDTGAKTASLSAQDLKLFTKNKEKWVRFQLENKKKSYEFPVERISKIKRREGDICSPDDETFTERPVIKLQVCLGSQLKTIEVNLEDRSRFEYELLIGKDGLSELQAIVDPSVSELSTPDCSTVK